MPAKKKARHQTFADAMLRALDRKDRSRHLSCDESVACDDGDDRRWKQERIASIAQEDD